MKNYTTSYGRVSTHRDIILLRVDRKRLLTVTCDSAGAIGSKSGDTIKAEPKLVGKMTARVALMELLAVGADPIAMSGTFSVEPKPTGDSVIEGIRQELKDSHLNQIPIICSSEKNFKVKQTGIGITAIGLVSNTSLKIGRCEPGDDVVALGEPHIGHEVIQAERKRRIANALDVIRCRKKSFVHELIPVGSRGMYHEAGVMATDSKLVFEPSITRQAELKKSAGPATVLLMAVRNVELDRVLNTAGRGGIRKIGIMRVK